MLTPAGERLSTKLLAAFLADQGTPATELPTDNLLLTTAEHGAAVPLLDATAARAKPVIQEVLGNGSVYVAPIAIVLCLMIMVDPC